MFHFYQLQALVVRPFDCFNAPINGLPQDGGVGQPRGIWLRKAYMGWDFDIHSDPQGGEFDSTAIFKSQEDLRLSDEWCAPLNDDMFWHCIFCVPINTMWNNSWVFSAVQNVCAIAYQNWTMLISIRICLLHLGKRTNFEGTICQQVLLLSGGVSTALNFL